MNGGTKNIGLNDPQTMRRQIVKMASKIEILESQIEEGSGVIENMHKLILRFIEITDELKDKIRRLEGGE